MVEEKLETLENMEFEDVGDFTVEDAETAEKELAGRPKTFRIPTGDTLTRVLPGRKGKQFYTSAWIHFFKLPGMKGAQPMICYGPNSACPCCLEIRKAQASGNPALIEVVDEWKAGQHYFFNAINLNEKGKGVQVFDVKGAVIKALVSVRKQTPDDPPFFHPTKGFPVTLTRTGTTINDTEYSATPFGRGSSPLADTPDAIRKLLGDRLDLDDVAAPEALERAQQRLRPPPPTTAIAAAQDRSGVALEGEQKAIGAGGADPDESFFEDTETADVVDGEVVGAEAASVEDVDDAGI